MNFADKEGEDLERICEPVGCWYLPLKAGKKHFHGIIDTGARFCLISAKCYNALPSNCKSKLEPVDVNLVNADGHKLPVIGKSSLSLEVEDQCFKFDVVVAHSLGQIQIIIGVDFLSAQEMTLDIANGVLTCLNKDFILTQKSATVNGIVLVEGDTIIPSKTEKWLKGIIAGEWKESDNEALIASITESVGSKLVLYEAVVTVTGGKELEFLVYNDSNEDIVLLSESPVAEVMVIESGTLVDPAEVTLDAKTSFPPINGGLPSDAIAVAETIEEEDIVLPDHLIPLYNKTVEDSDEAFKKDIKQFLWEHREAFSAPGDPPGLVKGYGYVARLLPGKGVPRQPVRRVGPALRQIIEKEAQKYINYGIWEECRTSTAENPLILIRKKGTEPPQYRIVSDLRIYNQSIQNIWGQQRVKPYQDLIDTVAGHKYYATLDLKHGFFNIKIDDEETKRLLAFTLPSGHRVCYARLPQGASDAPQVLEWVLSDVLHKFNWKCLCIYLDDIVLYHNDRDELIRNLKAVVARLHQVGFRLHPGKCAFNQTEILYLGHVLSAEGQRPNPKLVHSIKCWKAPTNVKTLQAFIGISQYYRRFVNNYSEKALALTKLLRKGQRWEWEQPQIEAFETLKACLTSEPILAAIPQCLVGTKLIIDCDASDSCIAGILGVQTEKGERVAAYFSKKTIVITEKLLCQL